jgi:hypothetical protein
VAYSTPHVGKGLAQGVLDRIDRFVDSFDRHCRIRAAMEQH